MQQGFLFLEGILEDGFRKRLEKSVDRLMVEGGLALEQEELGFLTTYPPIMDKLTSLLGSGFAMHHIHATRYEAGAPGRGWHHDYRQVPQSNRSHLMVHAIYYLSGLTGEIGDLLVLPGSQNTLVDMRQLMDLLGTIDLPGSKTVDSLAPGSVALLNSAMLHARRPKPGGAGQSRYFIDISYCQKGVLWPGYTEAYTWREANQLALERGYDRGGKYAHVFDSEQFFHHRDALNRLAPLNQGSLATKLLDPIP